MAAGLGAGRCSLSWGAAKGGAGEGEEEKEEELKGCDTVEGVRVLVRSRTAADVKTGCTRDKTTRGCGGVNV